MVTSQRSVGDLTFSPAKNIQSRTAAATLISQRSSSEQNVHLDSGNKVRRFSAGKNVVFIFKKSEEKRRMKINAKSTTFSSPPLHGVYPEIKALGTRYEELFEVKNKQKIS